MTIVAKFSVKEATLEQHYLVSHLGITLVMHDLVAWLRMPQAGSV